jgi:hypothetical protein
MMDLVSRHNNLYAKTDTEMSFVVTCSSAHKVFIHTLQHINMCTVHSATDI